MLILLLAQSSPAPKRGLGPPLQLVLQRTASGKHICIARPTPALTHHLERAEAEALGQIGFAGPLRR